MKTNKVYSSSSRMAIMKQTLIKVPNTCKP